MIGNILKGASVYVTVCVGKKKGWEEDENDTHIYYVTSFLTAINTQTHNLHVQISAPVLL